MTDIIDRAQEMEQLRLNAALANARTPAPKLPTGRCNYCKEPTKGAFCDSDCQEDYEYEQGVRARQNGVRQ